MTALAATTPTIDLRLGRWQDVLADVECDLLLTDPPYGERTHRGNSERIEGMGRSALSYDAWSPDNVREFVASWAPRCRGWFASMTSDDLVPVWREAYAAAGLYDFAPVPVLQHRPRLSGDGPGSGTIYLMVARPRSSAFMSWGSLPCWYEAPIDRAGHIGGKPLGLVQALVRDYSRRGDLVCDPCAGFATTLIAAAAEGRSAVGAEIDPATHTKAAARIARGYTPSLFAGDA